MKNLNDQKGQTLIAILVLMILALGVGLSVSSKFVKNLRNITQTDQSSRALAMAESAIENILIIPISTLEDYALNGTCGSDCHYEITSAEGELLIADVTLSKLGNSSEPYIVELMQDKSNEINLVGYPSGESIYLCWDAEDMSITGTYIHGVSGSYDADAFSYNPPTTTHGYNNFDTATPLFGYSSCITITSETDSQVIRAKSMYEDGYAVVLPAVGQLLPTQGILIESVGNAGDVYRTVSVIITDPMLPAQFDYVLYQKSITDPLSN